MSAKSFRSWVRRALSIASAACPATKSGGLDLLVPEPPRRIERDDRQRGEQLRRGRDRDDERGRALLEERDEELVRRAEPARGRRIEHERLVRQLVDRLLALEQRAQRLQPRVGHVRRPGDEQVAAPVEHADHRRVGVEQLDRGVVTESSVASSERLWANEREISYSARSRFADLRSEAIVSWSSVA